jgi:FkbM family methyltransferase
MRIPPFIPRAARRVLPARFRTALRRSKALRNVAALLFRGTTHRAFPNSDFELYFDGYRNIGFGAHPDSYEPEEQNIVRRILLQMQPTSVWDVGANIGIWSLFLTSQCSANTEIRCYEPDPQNLELLKTNMLRNNIDHWSIRAVALSNRNGVGTFYSDPVSGATGSLEQESNFAGKHFDAAREEYTVSLTTIDSEIASGVNPPQFIKIDVEGHELEVLQGAKETIRKYRPVLIFETTRNHSGIADYFRALNYELINVEGELINLPAFSTVAKPSELDLRFLKL